MPRPISSENRSGADVSAGRHDTLDARHPSSAKSHAGNDGTTDNFQVTAPSISQPKGGGALKGIDGKLEMNAASGTASFSIPVPATPGRNGNQPNLTLQYNSGNGNSPFGLGWSLNTPAISRKTERQLPQYRDDEEKDIFVLSGAEDLVPLLEKKITGWEPYSDTFTENNVTYTITRYRPRIEGLFARIEQWQDNDTGEIHWRTVSRDNVHSCYGLTAESRIVDPENAQHIFSWLLCHTHDDKGNITVYRYKQEDSKNIPASLSEKNHVDRCSQTYLKHVFYGNKSPWYRGDSLPEEDDFVFRILLDYGEHDDSEPIQADIHQEKATWTCRKDPFSSYLPGFDLRTYRQCRRILVFHCFDAPADLPINPYLVRSLRLFYDDTLMEGFSYLVKIRQCGHKWDTAANHYLTRSLPDIDLTYQAYEWNTSIHTLSPEAAADIPTGINNSQYLWIDLFSEGVTGILTEHAGSWYYKHNEGDGAFSAARVVATRPSFQGLTEGAVHVQELESDGIKYLVHYKQEPKGFFKLTEEEEWQPFRHFSSMPNIDMQQPDGRWIDLNGDGKAELLLTETACFRWYPSAGEKGFEVSRTVARALDEEKGPAIMFNDPQQSIFLADMSGDGLSDIVRIRNGEICYWPNLGYGRFGAKITMDTPPLFDHQDQYDPSLIRLADIDGSGTTDVIYLGRNTFRIWMNLNGNSWSPAPQEIAPFPSIHQMADISVVDFLGTGTSCIVYSSPLPQHKGRQVQFIDLMGSRKPHILKYYKNNCGLETSLEYKSSTYFYLQDKKEGNPWVTKLPFPVHVLVKKEVYDSVSQLRFTTSYSYHHGYYDTAEREFRGFGRVDQTDTETYEHFKRTGASNIVEEALHQPPVLTRTWFHTGAYLRGKKILHFFQQPGNNEYFINDQFEEYHLPDAVVTDQDGKTLENASPQIMREAARACRSMVLRQEVYALDETGQMPFPYSVQEHNCYIRLVQPHGANKHAVFLVTESENISYQYERQPADPRIAHSLNLMFDEYGLVRQAVAVVYGRVKTDGSLPAEVVAEQKAMRMILSENTYTEDAVTGQDYRLRAHAETITYELKGITPAQTYFNIQDFTDQLPAAATLPYHGDFTGNQPAKRVIEHVRTLYTNNTASSPLPLYKMQSGAIVHEKYKLAFTTQLVERIYGGRVTQAMLEDGQYRRSGTLKSDGLFPATDPDDNWWTPSGTAGYPANPAEHFFLAERFIDPFGHISRVFYDSKYHLYVERTEAPLFHTIAVNRFDYRVMAAAAVKDINDNLSEVAFDILGVVAGTAVKGKGNEADDLDNFIADLSQQEIDDLMNDPLTHGRALLQRATSRFVYDYTKQPLVSASVIREIHQHHADEENITPALQYSFEYSSGLGQILMKKIQAEPGPASFIDDSNVLQTDVPANPRWVGNGRTILNNKGKPVKQYEPYFSITHKYESDIRLVEIGVSPILYYDPAGRNIRTNMPDGTFTRTVYNPWQQYSYDANDTVKKSDWYEARINGDLSTIISEKTAAEKAAVHDDTPALTVLDSSGRDIYAVIRNKFIHPQDLSLQEEDHISFSKLDIEGNQRLIRDARNNPVMQYDYDMLGNSLYQQSMDTGVLRVFNDATGKIMQSWNDRLFIFRHEYDELLRPVRVFVKQDNNPEKLVSRTIYAACTPAEKALNRCGQIVEQYDAAGVIRNAAFDFKGNLLSSSRQLLKQYEEEPDWNQVNIPADMETDIYQSHTRYDALNRPLQMTMAEGSIIYPSFNEAGLLEKINVQHKGAGQAVTFVQQIDYDEKAQRKSILYGNNVLTKFSYDKHNFRLVRLLTTSGNGNNLLQDISYTYDPVGNITQIEDKAQQVHFFNNAVVLPVNQYTYDAVYRLIQANGREHTGSQPQPQDNWQDGPRVNLSHPQDGNAMREYIQQYFYDVAGNITQLRHIANGGSYTRLFDYEDANNRLKSVSVNNVPYNYSCNEMGSITSMPHLQSMEWNSREALCHLDLGGGGEAWHVYDSAGQRIRKIVVLPGGLKKETVYIGATEIYREINSSNTTTLQRETLHIMDGTRRIALQETKTIDLNDNTDLNLPMVRYQFCNHLGSSSLELNDAAQVVSYEEYHPFGTTAYQAMNKAIRSAAKRYRYTGKERDEETGLYYHGARYYAPWLARWSAADPLGTADGLNIYAYVANNPIKKIDPNGTDGYQLRVYNSGTDSYELCMVNGSSVNLDDCIPETSVFAYTGGDRKPPPPPVDKKDPPKPKPAPKQKEKPKPEKQLSASELTDLVLALNPPPRYPKPVRQFLGGVGFIGGSLEAGIGGVGGILTAETGVGLAAGGFLFYHGIDTASSNWTLMMTGEESRTWTFRIGVYTAEQFTDDKKLANAVGQSLDLTANLGAGAISIYQLGSVKPIIPYNPEFALPENLVMPTQWTPRTPGIMMGQEGGYWFKQVDPNANIFMRFWGQQSIEAQAKGLTRLGDMATPFELRNGILITQDVGQTAQGGFRLGSMSSAKIYWVGSKRMGTFFNDIQPRNMGTNGIIFDPAIDPVMKGMVYTVTPSIVVGSSYIGGNF